MASLVRHLFRWTVPGGGVLALAAGLREWADPELVREIAGGYPWVALGVAFLLGAVFHRSRVAVTALSLGGLLLVLERAPAPPIPSAAGATLLAVLAGLALARDGRVTARGALLQAGLVASVAAAVGAAAVLEPGRVTAVLAAEPLAEWLPAGTGFPPGVLAVAALAALASLGMALVRPDAVERGFVWLLPTVLVVLHPDTGPVTDHLFVLAAGVLLALTVLEASYRMAYRDDLTGLPGRRALMRDLADLTGTWSAAMVDVDHFKKFNDKHGHEVGDQVLKMVATRLADASGVARAYRYGGEEFTLLIPGRTREEAVPLLEKVREAVAESGFTLRGRDRPRRKPKGGKKRKARKKKAEPRTLSVTVSMGVADSEGGLDSPAAVLDAADQALYKAKRAGRNKVKAAT